jgi:uncharacterized DUF497 family protein
MDFEWDEAKNLINMRKHGVSFDDAKSIFDGRIVTAVDARFDYGEIREISTVVMGDAVVVTVVHTDREGRRRLISARRASPKEREHYETAV